MKYNGVLTLHPFNGKVKLKRSASRVLDESGAVIGGVSAYNVYDLNGEKIAGLSRVEQTDGGEVRYYEGYRSFMVKGDFLLLESGAALGRIIREKERSYLVPVIAVLMAVLAAAIIIISILGFPEGLSIPGDAEPVLIITDDGDGWGANDDLEVFDGYIYPGREGSYDFRIENPTEYTLEYTLTLTDENDWGGRSPMEYRIRMNNAYILGGEDEWHSMNDSIISISPLYFAKSSTQFLTIEWRWPFDSGNDEDDTLAGEAAGIYWLNIDVSAAVAGQE